MNTGMLPERAALKYWEGKKREKGSSEKEGEREGLVRRKNEVTTSSLCLSFSLSLSLSLSVRSDRSGSCKAWLSKLPFEPEQKSCSDKRQRAMESRAVTSVRPLQSSRILHEVMSSTESPAHTPTLPLLYLPFDEQALPQGVVLLVLSRKDTKEEDELQRLMAAQSVQE